MNKWKDCRCEIVGWDKDPFEPDIPAQPVYEQAKNCPVHPLERKWKKTDITPDLYTSSGSADY